MARRSSGGAGLIGILAVTAGLHYSGMGAAMESCLQGLDRQCYSMVPSVARGIGHSVCSGIGYGVNGASRVADTVGNGIQSADAHVRGLFGPSHFSGIGSLGSSFQQSIGGLSSSSDALERMMVAGPGRMRGGNVAQQFQQAIDSFSIGQRYLTQANSPAQAMPWLMQGAQQPQGFGLLSQLSLGDLYRNGGVGVAPNPAMAQQYYQMAAGSLAQLSQSNTPQSQQLLQALPASPQAMQQEITAAITQLNGAKAR